MVAFNQIPNGIKTPFVYVEFDNSRAVQGPSLQEYRVLIVGQKISAGTKPALERFQITSEDQAKQYFGNGSMLAHMLEKFLGANKVNQVYAIALDDDGAGVKASGKITMTGPATEAGLVSIMVAGRRVRVGVSSGDSADDIALNIKDKLEAELDLPVDVAINGTNANEVDLTAKNAGEAGNEIDIRINYFEGEELPSGVGATITSMNSGVGNPDIQDALDILDDTQYNIIVNPYSDASNLTALEAELSERFGPLKQNDGYALVGKRGDFSTLTTFGNSRNSQFTIIREANGPMSPYEKVSSEAGVIALNGQIDPARPFQTLEVPGILAPKGSEIFTQAERNQLLNNGVGTSLIDDSGVVRFERVITSYKTNAFGASDPSYYDLNTLLTLSYLRFDFRNTFLRKFPRHKLANDGTRIAPGQPILTPKSGKAEAVSIFRGWEELGLVEGAEQFKNDLIVERNAQDPNRLDFLLPPDLINQLRVTGVQIQFLL
jgi:phage tail sheath gpL-like